MIISDGSQRTLRRDVVVAGVGLFTGQPARVTLKPAAPGEGITFVRADQPTRVRIPATVEHLAPAHHRSALAIDEARVDTVEHCLGALVGLGIDNATIEVLGPELPAGDGSCELFSRPIADAGVIEQDAPRRVLVIDEPLEVRCDTTGAQVVAMPLDDARAQPIFRYELDYGPDAPIRAHSAAFDFTHDDFARDLSFARTFSTRQEAEQARAMGLFTHVEPRDMLVIGEHGPIDNALHREDEPARHKIIDMLGDLALAGVPVRAAFVGRRSGHALNHRLAQTLHALSDHS